MRTATISGFLTSLALTWATPGVADPRPVAPPPPPGDTSDSVQITMTAGKGRLGVSVLQISSELRGHLGAPGDRGVLVDTMRPDSPAARAGVRVGDVILEVDGTAITTAPDVLHAMTDRKKGDTVVIAILRAGHRSDVRATLDEDPGTLLPHGGRDRMNPQLRRWLFEDMPAFDTFGEIGPDGVQRALDSARKRMQEMERRLERLERSTPGRTRT